MNDGRPLRRASEERKTRCLALSSVRLFAQFAPRAVRSYTSVQLKTPLRPNSLVAVAFSSLPHCLLTPRSLPTPRLCFTPQPIKTYNNITEWPHLETSARDYIDLSLLTSSADLSTMLPAISSFIFIGIFDVSGVMFGLSALADLVEADGSVPGGIWGFLGSGFGTVAASLMGCSPIIVTVECAAGIKEGGRTGLTACVIGLLFLLSLFLAPLLGSVPPPGSEVAQREGRAPAGILPTHRSPQPKRQMPQRKGHPQAASRHKHLEGGQLQSTCTLGREGSPPPR